jgi:hypothetical protein
MAHDLEIRAVIAIGLHNLVSVQLCNYSELFFFSVYIFLVCNNQGAHILRRKRKVVRKSPHS